MFQTGSGAAAQYAFNANALLLYVDACWPSYKGAADAIHAYAD